MVGMSWSVDVAGSCGVCDGAMIGLDVGGVGTRPAGVCAAEGLMRGESWAGGSW